VLPESRLRPGQPTVALALATALLVAFAAPAHAEPQFSSALEVGAGPTTSTTRSPWGFHLGARGDVLLLRSRDREMGVGPYVEVASERFATFDGGGGLEWLIPISTSFPVVLSGGGAAFVRPGAGWEPAVAAAMFVGSRGFNFDGSYGLTAGLFVRALRSFGDAPSTSVVVGAEIDLSLLAYPALFIYGALKK
jgi:hypothetical protein